MGVGDSVVPSGTSRCNSAFTSWVSREYLEFGYWSSRHVYKAICVWDADLLVVFGQMMVCHTGFSGLHFCPPFFYYTWFCLREALCGRRGVCLASNWYTICVFFLAAALFMGGL